MMCDISYIKYISLLSTYGLKISNFISRSTEDLCSCKKKMIITTWVYLCNWFLENGIRANLKSDSEIRDELKEVQNSILGSLNRNNVEKNVLLYYQKTLELDMEEICSAIIYNVDKEDKETNIYAIGELFLIFAKHTILEVINLPISYFCKELDCPERNRDSKNLVVYITDIFQMNSFAIRKMEILAGLLKRDTKNEEIELDFSFVKDLNFGKVQKILTAAKTIFKSVKLTGIDKKYWEEEPHGKKETFA